MMGASVQTPLMKHVAFIPKLVVSLPEWLAKRMGEGLSNIVKQRAVSSYRYAPIKYPELRSILGPQSTNQRSEEFIFERSSSTRDHLPHSS
jgi:hypothetical protein